jgi:hypothetical protein
MRSDALLAEMERATYTAWVVTAIAGVVSGILLQLIFRTMARITRMRVASATFAIVLGVFVFAGIQALRYRIEESPFEPPVWIHPGWISLYLPLLALVVGAALTAVRNKRVSGKTLVGLAVLVALVLAGFGSNLIARHSVERRVSNENEEHIQAVRRLWHLPSRKINTVPPIAVHFRTDTAPDGGIGTFPLPPNTPTPFAFAHARSFAPFVLEVQYGWADGGARMAFGEGGELLVASLFGTPPVVIRRRPGWNF